MTRSEKKARIPPFRSDQAERDFWARHSVEEFAYAFAPSGPRLRPCRPHTPRPPDGRLRVVAMEGRALSDQFSVGVVFDRKDSYCGWAFDHQRPIVRADISATPEYSTRHRVLAAGIRSHVFQCPRCGGRRRIVGVHTGGERLRVMLERLGLVSASPSAAPARSPLRRGE